MAAEDEDGVDDPPLVDDQALVEEFGRQIGGAMGWPRTAGRAAAVLMLHDGPMTLAQLQRTLGASKGSVSETTRLLITSGTVARFKEPGRRHFVYQWREDAWIGCLQHQLDQTAQLLALAESAQARTGHLPAPQRGRIREMAEYYRLVVSRLEALHEEYSAGWRARHPDGES